VLDRPAYRLRASQVASEFARIDTRSVILSIINRAVADQGVPFAMATSQPGARLASGDPESALAKDTLPASPVRLIWSDAWSSASGAQPASVQAMLDKSQ
jgi:hypothetical protein